MLNEYLNIVFYSTKSLRKIKAAEKYFQSKSLNDQDEKSINQFLFKEYKLYPDKVEPLLCLRCKVSFYIKRHCKGIYSKFKNNPNIELDQIYSICLNDNGSLRFKPYNNSKIITLNFYNLKKKYAYLPCGIETIISFNEKKQSDLSSWAYTKTKSYKLLKSYFNENNIQFERRWTFLNNQSTNILKKAWKKIKGEELSQDNFELYQKYLENYSLYKNDFTGFRWEPIKDQKFLDKLKIKNDSQLREFSEVIKSWKKLDKNAVSLDDNEKPLKTDEFEDEIDFKFDEIINLLEYEIKLVAIKFLKRKFKSEEKIFTKFPDKKLAWEYYSQGYSTRKVSSMCGRGIKWGSTLIQETSLSKIISREVIRHFELNLIKIIKNTKNKNQKNFLTLFNDYLLESKKDLRRLSLEEHFQMMLLEKKKRQSSDTTFYIKDISLLQILVSNSLT